MKKDNVRKKEERVEIKKRKTIFMYGVIGILSLFFVYILTTYILSTTNVINEGNFRINDFVITSKASVEEQEVKIYEQDVEENKEEIESDINNAPEVIFNVSQENVVSILIPESQNATISKVYLNNIKLKGTDRVIYVKDVNNEEINLNEKEYVELAYEKIDNQYLVEFSLNNKNIIENATIPEGLDSIVYDGTIFSVLGYDTQNLKYEIDARLNVEDSTGKTSICNFSLEFPVGNFGENGIVIQREDVTKYNLKLKTKILEFFE